MSNSSVKLIFQILILFLAFSTKAQDSTYTAKVDRQTFWDNLPKPLNWTNDYENIFSDDEEA